MSIVDSQVERTEAEARLAGATPEQLERDLVYWSVAGRDHAAEWTDLSDRLGVVRGLYAESTTWVQLIADELVRRRDERRAG